MCSSSCQLLLKCSSLSGRISSRCQVVHRVRYDTVTWSWRACAWARCCVGGVCLFSGSLFFSRGRVVFSRFFVVFSLFFIRRQLFSGGASERGFQVIVFLFFVFRRSFGARIAPGRFSFRTRGCCCRTQEPRSNLYEKSAQTGELC